MLIASLTTADMHRCFASENMDVLHTHECFIIFIHILYYIIKKIYTCIILYYIYIYYIILYIHIYIHILYEEGSSYNIFWVTTSYNKLFLHFQTLNRQSKPLDVISTIKCAWRPNFTFFGIFLLFIKMGTKFNGMNLTSFCTHLNK